MTSSLANPLQVQKRRPRAIELALFLRTSAAAGAGLISVKLASAVGVAAHTGASMSVARRGPLPVLAFDISDRGFARIVAQSTLATAVVASIALLVSVLVQGSPHRIAALTIGVASVTIMMLGDLVLLGDRRRSIDTFAIRWTVVVLLPAWLLAVSWFALERPRFAWLRTSRRAF